MLREISVARTRFWRAILSYAHVNQTSVRSSTTRNGLFLLGIGASTIFALHEMSVINNDVDRTPKTQLKSTEKRTPHAFDDALSQQNIIVPDWTDNGIRRVDIATLAA